MPDHKHTPGPWIHHVDADKTSVMEKVFFDLVHKCDDSGRPIQVIAQASWCEKTRNEVGANARLIANAPELLEACESAAPALKTLCKAQNINLDGSSAFAIAYRNLLSAIAKATGGKE